MKCIICGEETSGSIGGKNVCPPCDCGIGVFMDWDTGKLVRFIPAPSGVIRNEQGMEEGMR